MPTASYLFIYIFLKDFICLFLERREGREKEREGNTDVSEKHRSVVSRPPWGPSL